METNAILNIKSNSRKWQIFDATTIKLIADAISYQHFSDN